MNKLLYVARKAKGFTPAQIAQALQIEESIYKEMEASLVSVTVDVALKFARLFNIDADLFIYTEENERSMIKFAMDGDNELQKMRHIDRYAAALSFSYGYPR